MSSHRIVKKEINLMSGLGSTRLVYINLSKEKY